MSSSPLSRVPLLGFAAAAALALPTAAQTTKLISTGDVLPGLGTVTSVREFDFAENGDWFASVRTDLMAPGSSEAVLVRNGVVVLKPGDAVPGYPAGADFSNATRLALDAAGDYAWVAQVLSANIGVYRGTVPYLVNGDPIAGAGIAPGTVCTGIVDYVFEPGGTLLVSALMTGSDLPGLHDRVIARAAAHGSGFTATSILKGGDSLPGATSAVYRFSTFAQSMSSNATGNVIYGPEFLGGDEGIYLDAEQLALTGQPSPVFGLNWASLANRPVALNDAGDYAFSGRILAPADSNELLVWNGIAVAREGDVLPAIAPHAITAVSGSNLNFGAPIRLTQDGRVLWYASWNDPDTTRDSGLFLDHELVVQEGVTHVGGVPIDEFGGGFGQAEFDISADGTLISVRALLANGEVSAFVLRPAGGLSFIPGCAPNAGSLSADAAPQLGVNFTAFMDDAQADGSLAFLFVSTQLAVAAAPCGIALPGVGEILIDFNAPNPLLTRAGLWPANPFGFPMPTPVAVGMVPNLPALFGKTFYAQGAWLDLSASAAEPVRLTNALALSIGE
jgi:hypothetical protein